MKFSDKMIKLRKLNGFTQETFADEVGVSRQSVYKWENGTSYPEVEKLLKIARTFSITVDDLLNEEMGVDENGYAVRQEELDAMPKEEKKTRRTRKTVVKMTEAATEEKAGETPVEATAAEIPAEEPVAEPVAEAPAEEPAKEEAPVEEPAAVTEPVQETPKEEPKEEKKEKRGFFGLFRRHK